MAIQEYAYSIEDDFVINHKVDPTILQDEIIASAIVITEIHHIYANLDDDDCQIWFFDALTNDEEIELDAIVAAHTGVLPGGIETGEVGDQIGGEGGTGTGINIFFGDHSDISWFAIKGNPWQTIHRFIFEGTNTLGFPVGVKALMKSKDFNNPEKTSSLRLYDITNSNVIFSWELFHAADWKICAENVANFPSGETIFELQGAKEPGECWISNFKIVFSGVIVNNMP